MTTPTKGALDGITVLDLSRDLAGPYTSMMLGELGADVLEVEHPATGDETRLWPPIIEGVSAYFGAINRSKRSLAVDLKSPAGIGIIHDLARRADVVMQSFSPGVADRLGVGYESIRAINPEVIYHSISGFGQDGPWRTKRGYDPILQAASGFMSVTGEEGRGPVKSMIPIADLSTAIYGTTSILAAIVHKERTGEGQYIDLSMLDVMVSMLSVVGTRYLLTGEVPPRLGTRNPQRTPSAAFECGDGVWLQLVPNQRQWPAFTEVVGRPDWATDERFATPLGRVRNSGQLYAELEKIFLARPVAEWIAALDQINVACSPINPIDDVFALPQVHHRGMVTTYDVEGHGEVPGIALPFRLSQTPSRIRSAPPRLGEHTRAALREIGRTDQEIDALVASGVVTALGEPRSTGDPA